MLVSYVVQRGGGKKKRLSMASAVCARGAFAKGSRWEDADVGWEEEKKKLLIIEGVQSAAM